MTFILKQVGLGEALLEAETIEEQESPVNCFRKLFGKKRCILYYFFGISGIPGIVISGLSHLHNKRALCIIKFSPDFIFSNCKAF